LAASFLIPDTASDPEPSAQTVVRAGAASPRSSGRRGGRRRAEVGSGVAPDPPRTLDQPVASARPGPRWSRFRKLDLERRRKHVRRKEAAPSSYRPDNSLPLQDLVLTHPIIPCVMTKKPPHVGQRSDRNPHIVRTNNRLWSVRHLPRPLGPRWLRGFTGHSLHPC